MGLTIIKYPDRRLFEPSARITSFNKDLRVLVLWMKKLMKGLWGKAAGLAAPQVGRNIQLCIVYDEVIINPTILTKSPKTFLAREGCYSLKEEKFDYPVERHQWVIVEYQRLNGKLARKRFSGIRAQAMQHELNHLEGVLCTGDRLLKASLKQEIKLPESVKMTESLSPQANLELVSG